MNKKVILMILDGWGNSPDPKVSAIDHANTPFIDSLYKKYPYATLRTDGLHVGLPEGQMGNSEVGHMNLGAGRIVYQDLAKINLAIEKDTLKDEKVLIDALKYASDNNKNVHFLGLLSNGGVHAHTSHLKGFIDAANKAGVNSFVHAFTDGRDVDPKSGKGYVEDLENHIKGTNTKIATITGRYYAMDRDKRWERVQLAYDAIINGVGTKATNPTSAIQTNYDNDITDEFIKPLIITDKNNNPIAKVQEDDVIIFFNFRTDRGRELTEMLSQKDFLEYNTKKIELYYVTITNYSDAFEGIKVIFNKDNITETLGVVLAKHGN
jgi:2,3-bisphosphoglycerate-independent phosphoglycerate mutase